MAESKYRVLLETLKKEILSGKYGPQQAFPSIRALIRRTGLSKNTVQHAIDELVHRGLISRSQGRGTFVTRSAACRKIGLLIHGTSYCEIFSPIARAISHLCQENEYALLFADVAHVENRRRVVQVIRQAREYVKEGVAGVIFQPVEMLSDAETVNREILDLFDAAGIPVVLLDSDIAVSPKRSAYDLASVNHFDAGRRLGLYLRETGAKRVAYLMQKNRAPCVQERYLGIRTACAGLSLAGEALLAEPDDVVRVRRFVRTKKPDAIACYNDRQAVILIKTLARIGLEVPKDIAIAGFDDVNYATLATPCLTTMHQPCDELAALAFDMLMARMREPSAPIKETFLNAPLVVRDSTRRPRRR